jgi:mono/diheme cytochrome c family protein
MRKLLALVAFSILVAPLAARADETTITLKPGDGVEETSAQCAACHSLDYIQMNSPFLSAAAWKAEVAKMRKVFAAPFDDEMADKIATYLAAQYGPAG